MNERRRSMSQALRTVELSPEAVELIHAGRPKPKAEHSVLAEETPQETVAKRAVDSRSICASMSSRITRSAVSS